MNTPAMQRGATTIEFALVFMLFMTFLLGIVDFSRMLWTWNAANEATRWGARTAVVCDKGAAAVLSNMQRFIPELTAANLEIDWYGADGQINAACDSTNCSAVNVGIVDLDYQWISPIGSLVGLIPMPRFATYLPREVMGQDPNSAAVCS